jgi:hypothetical protein
MFKSFVETIKVSTYSNSLALEYPAMVAAVVVLHKGFGAL